MATNERQVELSSLDRLGSLPDELLLHIMWFLWARQAVQTCVLSKRWKNLWRHLTSLNFNRFEFNCNNKFINFVNSFFNLRENIEIDMFRLDWAFSFAEAEPTKAWILHALNLRPRLVSIRIIGIARYFRITLQDSLKTLPDSLFACNSLEAIDLRISSSMVAKIRSNHIQLLNLKRLSLRQGRLNDEFMKKLISGSPRLEELIMEYCTLYNSDITIISHSLKSLIIKRCSCFHGFAIHLSISSLLSLHVIGADLGDIRSKDMPSLLKACVHYNQTFRHPPESRYELLWVLSNVSHLQLIGKPYQKITKSKSMRISVLKNLLNNELPACGAFVNLKKLHLSDWFVSDDFDLIARFIQLSPNLETLTMSHEKEILHAGLLEKLYLQIQFNRPEVIEIKCSVEHDRVNELIGTLQAYLGRFKRFHVDTTGNFSAAFCNAVTASNSDIYF